MSMRSMFEEIIDLTRGRYCQILAQTDALPASWCEEVRRVVLILSASRAGSSLVKSLITTTPQVLTLSGEEEPYYVLSKNIFPFSGRSDVLSELVDKQFVQAALINDMGYREPRRPSDMRKLRRDWALRLLVQYTESPAVEDSRHVEKLMEHVDRSYCGYSVEPWGAPSYVENLNLPVQYYDVSAIKKTFTTLKMPGPVSWYKIEELPFVAPLDLQTPTKEDLHSKPLILKTPQDCYRLPIFKQLFPNAEILVVFLKRGLAQTVNALCDGWEYDFGFFSHHVTMGPENSTMNIKGYSDVKPWGAAWWNFDLPPGWETCIQQPLHQVCAYQWFKANRTILDYVLYDRDPSKGAGVSKVLQIPFERILDSKTRMQSVARICEFIGIEATDGIMQRTQEFPEVMTTVKPSPYDWEKREPAIRELLKDKLLTDLHQELGYSMDERTWI